MYQLIAFVYNSIALSYFFFLNIAFPLAFIWSAYSFFYSYDASI